MDLLIAGNVQTILSGHVSPESLCPISVEKMPYALGGAEIPDSNLSLGETIIYEGVGHIFTLKKTWEEKQTLQAAFLMGIPKKPKTLLQIRHKQEIQALYQDLIKNYPTGFAIVGTATFSKLSVAYLKLSPIYQENINAHQDKYWNQENFNDRKANLFGVVLSKPDPRAFYDNPNEKNPDVLLSHTHVLSHLARHLLTHSEVSSGTFWIEAIDHIRSY